MRILSRIRALAILFVVGLTMTLAACGGTSSSSTASSGASDSGSGSSSDKTVTVYSADGLGDWYKKEFDAFEKKTGIHVNYVEAGSGEVVSRVAQEKGNPQADLVVTLPPFIQQAKSQKLLQANVISTDAIDANKRDKDGTWVTLADNYFTMIRSTSANPAPATWDDLLKAEYAHKIQYSTPGQAGDGTALLVLLEQEMGKDKAMEYLGKLQANNVGPSSSTGKLGPKVSSGELVVANSDVQMAQLAIKNDKVAYETFFPADANGKKATVALPYAMGVVANAPHKDAAKQLANFLLSKDVQETIPADAMGFPARNDVTASGEAADTLKKAMDGVTIITPNWDDVQANLGTDLEAYKKATNQ